MSAHTPAPWTADVRTLKSTVHIVRGPDGWALVKTVDPKNAAPEVSEANARLIAASPTLLAVALKVEELSRFAGSLEEFDAQFDAVMVDVRAAIALANGEQA